MYYLRYLLKLFVNKFICDQVKSMDQNILQPDTSHELNDSVLKLCKNS